MRTPFTPRDATPKAPAVVSQLKKIQKAGETIRALGMRFNAGHALNYFNVEPVARLPGVRELHIGHAIVSRAVFVGMREAVREMKRLITDAAQMIYGVGTDLSRSGASRRRCERFGERFAQRILCEPELKRFRGPPAAGRLPRQALRRQGGLHQGARHRHPRAGQLARRLGDQPAVGEAGT